MDKTRIFFLSEESESISFLEDVLSNVDGYETFLSSDTMNAAENFRRFLPAITVVDLDRNFPDALFRNLREICPVTRFLGFGSDPLQLTPFQQNFFSDILSKDDLRLRFMTAVNELKKQAAIVSTISKALTKIIGHSTAVKKLYQTIFKAIRSKGATVLITGESGVGKELVAKAIASVSSNLVSVNCSAITESLFESELFGHARGAFTGAISERKGLFEAANGGVLFLDEVGDIPLSMQAKLLRSLQEGEIRPIGSNETKKIKAQIIAATNHDLQKEAAAGKFREDLFYRLNVIPIEVPALRDRKEDIPDLINHFVREFSLRPNFIPKISDETMQALIRYDWPGNIRELENAIHRGLILMDGEELTLENIFTKNFAQQAIPAAARTWENIDYKTFQELQREEERQFILAKLKENNYSVTRTAESFGIQRPALYALAKRVGLDVAQQRNLDEEKNRDGALGR
ncbi:MAG: sigma-54 dependent transcriptional regulator [Hallerella porci]|uniref:DNA-binding NtrC family response regulator n=1 Tax=Hallerella porci TaxID=1945871 RepID=A0ABX5LLW2_9BACT|nr:MULTISPECIES: sigma-54 dependent transcriptional regulator [Hallerella]MCI5600321.1 sigma-54 dependent transcriptional regulator [Hallerella sp.]MDY3921605.1 sigma-54 dependent transcriptional regulator [Hallerella porci]PWK93348.1 DNA-binding NtrC family response regulator [Hallerella porci]